MPTRRLYFADAYLTAFSAQVVARRERDGRHEVALDQSAFYPEGGGQPADHGTLGGIAVLDVQVEDGAVWHQLAGGIDSDVVQGQLDWARRLDHMQQHCGQHLLSAVLERHFALPTVAFHLGAAVVTIDLDGSFNPDQAAQAEALVNQLIWDDLPVLARFVDSEQLASLALRRPPSVSHNIRVVSIGTFDHSACGGTHPRSTGGIGMLHIRRSERRGKLTRVEFLCGGRAGRDYQRCDTLVQQLAAQFSCAADEVGAAVARLSEAEQRSRKQLAQANVRLLQYEASELIAQALPIGSLCLVRQVFGPRPLEELRLLATSIAAAGCVALLASSGEQAQLILARPKGAEIDCGAVLKQVLATFGGRGGGQPALAQGGLANPQQLPAAIASAERLIALP
ncbi:MAG: alanyl-tRNA editing protein [Roseiflexaceae bacterium]|nr:alanyl-tRNA editing protein [Roseiflexaceae bacterium]